MDAHQEQGVLGDVPLYLAEAGKAVETTPNGIAIGMIRLRSWQLHRVEPLPLDFDGHAAHLVRANYEFDIAPDVPAPSWAEVDFQFGDPEVTVVDATPRAVTRAADYSEYELTEKLTFVLRGQRADNGRIAGVAADGIVVPAVQPRIACFGLGSDSIRWRHSESVPAGTHTGWFVMLTPPGYTMLRVVGGGEYHVETDPQLKLRPASRRDAFTVTLPDSPGHALIAGGPQQGISGSRRGPRVFVSYAHESPVHMQAVARLCSLLTDQGVYVTYDQLDPQTRREWQTWTTTQILRSDYVIAIASPAYRGVGDGTLPLDENLGLRSEYLRLADLLHRDRETWTRKLLPVILPGQSPEELPLSFLPGIGNYYRVDDFTAAGTADLLDVLLNGLPPS